VHAIVDPLLLLAPDGAQTPAAHRTASSYFPPAPAPHNTPHRSSPVQPSGSRGPPARSSYSTDPPLCAGFQHIAAGDATQRAMLKPLFWIFIPGLPYLQITSGIPETAHTRTPTRPGTGARGCVCFLLYFSTKRETFLSLYKYSQIRRLSRPFDLRTRCWNFAVNLLQCCNLHLRFPLTPAPGSKKQQAAMDAAQKVLLKLSAG